MWYLSSWRDLRRRSNAGHGLGDKPEITPPSHSYHRPDGTAGRTPSAAAGVGVVPLLHGPEPLEPADRLGVGPEPVRRAGDDGTSAPWPRGQSPSSPAGG